MIFNDSERAGDVGYSPKAILNKEWLENEMGELANLADEASDKANGVQDDTNQYQYYMGKYRGLIDAIDRLRETYWKL